MVVEKAVKPVVKAAAAAAVIVKKSENPFADTSITANLCLLQAIINTCGVFALLAWTNNGKSIPENVFKESLGIKSTRPNSKGWTVQQMSNVMRILAMKHNYNYIFIKLEQDKLNWIFPINRLLHTFSRAGRYLLIVRPKTSLDKTLFPTAVKKDKSEQELADIWNDSLLKNYKRIGKATHAIGVIVHEDKSCFFYDNGCKFIEGGKPFSMSCLEARCTFISRVYVHDMTEKLK